jgi:hypothetical protein
MKQVDRAEKQQIGTTLQEQLRVFFATVLLLGTEVCGFCHYFRPSPSQHLPVYLQRAKVHRTIVARNICALNYETYLSAASIKGGLQQGRLGLGLLQLPVILVLLQLRGVFQLLIYVFMDTRFRNR